MHNMIEEMLKQQRLLDQIMGNSAIDQVLKHQRLIDQVIGNSSMREVMRHANAGREIYDQLAKYDSAMAGVAGGYLGLGSARRFIDEMNALSEAARLTRGYDSGGAISEAARLTALGHHYGGAVESSSALTRALASIDGNAVRMAREVEQSSAAALIAKELESTRRMLLQPQWAVVTGEAIKALHGDLLGLYDEHSIYREILERMQEGDSSEALTAEDEAEGYFEIIRDYLASAFRGVKHLGPAELLTIAHVVFTIAMEIHAMHWRERMEADAADLKGQVVELADQEQHTAAVVEALAKKLDAAMENLSAQLDEVQPIKWAARDRTVAVRVQRESGARLVGGVLPFQVVTQIDHDGKWIQVEFQDHKAGVARIGWAMKKDLERITPKRQLNRGHTTKGANPGLLEPPGMPPQPRVTP